MTATLNYTLSAVYKGVDSYDGDKGNGVKGGELACQQ